MQLTSLRLSNTEFKALPPSWTALGSLCKLDLYVPGPLDAAGALQPLGSWTLLTSLHIDGNYMPYTRGSLEQQLTRLSALQDLHIEYLRGFELPLGCWQGQLTSLECDLRYVLPADASLSSAAAMLAHATALRRLVALASGQPTQHQLHALLGALAALPALERVLLPAWVKGEVQEAHTALGSPLGERLQCLG